VFTQISQAHLLQELYCIVAEHRIGFKSQTDHSLNNFRISPPCKQNLCSSGILRSVEWKLPSFMQPRFAVTDVSEQPVGPIFKGQAFQKD
jgi:hypothetical protein